MPTIPDPFPELAPIRQAAMVRQAIADACADIAPDSMVTNVNVQAAIDQARTYISTPTANVTNAMTVNMTKTLVKIVFYMVRKILLPGYN